MTSEPMPRVTGRMIAGGILILMGVLFALDNFGVIDAGRIWDYWPLILIGVGLAKIIQCRRADQRVGGIILVAIGSFFLLQTLHIGWFRFRHFWPFLLLLIGGALIWQALASKRESFESSLGENRGGRPLEGSGAGLGVGRQWRGEPGHVGGALNEFAFMGGGDRVVRAQDFRGGEVTAIMGGFHIDLRGAAIAGDTATIEVFTFWGGVDMKVPEDWHVAMHGVPILGVFTNSARAFREGEPSAKTLIVKGVAIMGGVEVKN